MLHPNHGKYLKAPSREQIKKVVAAHQVNNYQFERFYGISKHTLNNVFCTARSLPPKYWHIIYECLRMMDEDKPMPMYKDEQPKPPTAFKIKLPFFEMNKKKKTPKKKKVKRTGSLCELC